MNSLKGLGLFVVLAVATYAISKLANIYEVVLGATVLFVSVSSFTLAASFRRRRRDHRIVGD